MTEPRLLQAQAAELETPLQLVEERLQALSVALQSQDSLALDRAATELHQALAAAVDRFGRAARSGGVPPVLRQRLAACGGQVAAQREALARATASLDRAIDVLIPRVGGPSLYNAAGETARSALPGGSLLA
ncbi:hypothetical protein [Rubrivivax sp. A210]|uniref:hypothetical protein n=1 Tax=Rubrivivax sp. A210 TaxID=2772301 RepID=UPI001F45A7FB|nr:hypothetical protein [Rubrivivax sp. A210]